MFILMFVTTVLTGNVLKFYIKSYFLFANILVEDADCLE